MAIKFFYCKNCLMPSTRPRNTFVDGICNGCLYTQRARAAPKVKIPATDIEIFADKKDELYSLCDKYRGNGKQWDMIIPFSGGKDSYHIAYAMKALGMKPLLVKIAPLIPTRIGRKNEENIRDQGFDLIVIHPSREYVEQCKRGFIEQGRPQMGFVQGLSTIIAQEAMARGIQWAQWGEEGETIYGGKTDYSGRITPTWIREVYFSGDNPNRYGLPLWYLPNDKEFEKAGLEWTHWSHFALFDGYTHFQTAKKMGFNRNPGPDDGVTGKGTFTDYTSLDDPFMRTLHTYLGFLKFGFGRGSQEACAEIRGGRMTREGGIAKAKEYDSYDCRDFKDKILKLFDMTNEEFDAVCDVHANKALLEKTHGVWKLKPEFHHNIFIKNAIEIDYDGAY